MCHYGDSSIAPCNYSQDDFFFFFFVQEESSTNKKVMLSVEFQKISQSNGIKITLVSMTTVWGRSVSRWDPYTVDAKSYLMYKTKYIL